MSPEPQPTYTQFSRYLRQATHDKDHEQTAGVGLTHYWDQSALAFPLRGFRALPPEYPAVNDEKQRELLVGALFAARQLGTVHLLPAHAVEFRNTASVAIADLGRSKHYQRFKDSQNPELTRLLDKLASEVDIDNANVDELSEMVGRLRDLDPTMFITLMSLSGEPSQNVHEWLSATPRMIEFDRVLSTDSNELARPPFGLFYDLLTKLRPAPDRANGNITDALVLATLARRNELRAPPHPRFYTNTPALQRLFRNPAVSAYFAFDVRKTESSPAYRDTIWRTSEYYYIRSLFPALRITHPAADGEEWRTVSEGSSPSFEELRQLAIELNRLLETSPARFDAEIERYEFASGKRLNDFLIQFDQVGMAHVWANLRLPEVTSGILQQVRSRVDDMSSSEKFQLALGRAWPDMGYFVRDVADLRMTFAVASDTVKRLRDRAGESLERVTEYFLDDDIFAQRWSAPVSESFKRSIISALRGEQAAADLVEVLEVRASRTDSTNALATQALLYGLDSYEFLLEAGNRTRNIIVDDSTRLGLTLVQSAGRLRIALAHNDTDLAEGIVRETQARWQTASTRDKNLLGLGFGHIFSICFQRTGPRSGGNVDESTALVALRQVATHLQGQLPVLRGDVARYAFSVNFLAHNSLFVDDLIENPKAMFLELARLASTEQRFELQVRFADTLAYQVLRQGVHNENMNLPGCVHIGQALQSYRGLAARNRSRTIIAHLSEAEAAFNLYNC